MLGDRINIERPPFYQKAPEDNLLFTNKTTIPQFIVANTLKVECALVVVVLCVHF